MTKQAQYLLIQLLVLWMAAVTMQQFPQLSDVIFSLLFEEIMAF